jgi:predicted secreted protein
MSVVLGLDAVLYRGAKGSQASTEVTNVKDLSLNLESGEADVTTRATEGWKASVATLKEASLEFGMVYDTADADFNAFQSAYFNNEPLSLFISDGAGTGLDADFSITGFNVTQNLEEAMTVSVKAKPTASTRAPQWVVGSGGGSSGGN